MSSTTPVIGYVTDIQGHAITASLVSDDQEQPPVVTVGDEDVLVGQLGSYVAVRQGEIHMVAIVSRMAEQEALGQNASEAPADEAIRMPFAKRHVRLTPIGSVKSDGAFERGVGRFPTTGATIHPIGAGEIESIFSRYREKDFSVGTSPQHPSLRIYLDPTNLFGRHFAILGQTGSGKSWTVASMLQRAVSTMPNAHILLLDLHGEYCWNDADGESDSAFDREVVRHIDARDLEMPYWLMSYAELCDLLVDQTDFSAHNQVATFRDVLNRLRSEEGNRLGLDRTTVDTPVYFDLEELRSEIEASNGQIRGAKEGTFKAGPLTGKFDNFLMRLDSKLNDSRYDFLLKPRIRNNSDSLADLMRELVGIGEEKAQITVLDLSRVPFDVRPTVAAQVGRLVFEFNYWNAQRAEFPICLVCEEAHAYIPRSSESQYAGSRKSMERIAKEGRKYGVGLGIATQRPHEVSETVLAQCGTFVCMRLTNPEDQNYVRSLVPESEGDFTNVVSGLGRGEALILGEAAPVPSRVQIECPSPTPNSNDVEFYEKWKVGVEEVDVEGLVRRWRNQRS